MASKQAAASTLLKLSTILAEEFEKEMTLTQVLTFARIAAAGDAGMDQGRIEKELKLSSAGASRTVQALSKIHYQKVDADGKPKPGYDVVESVMDAMDRRLRLVKLTPKGEKIMAKLQAALS